MLAIHGPYFTAERADHVKAVQDACLLIDDQGMISRIVLPTDNDFQNVLQEARLRDRLVELKEGEYVLPGFIDLHIHAPQWPQAGLALDRPLADWLNTYTFPLEAKYADAQYAHLVYDDLVHELLAHGTTTAMMFGSIHLAGNLQLVNSCRQQGLRGYIGQVVMDNPDQTPVDYRNASAQSALDATEEFIQKVNENSIGDQDLVTAVITPRFVPSCTDEALAGLGFLAKKYDLPIQTHLSESNWEHQYAIDRFDGLHDAEVLDHFGLMTDKAVMAHATQLTESDQSLVRKRQSAIAHCPISNVYFGNGVLPVKKLLQADTKLGLGSDISGGYSPSLYHNMRQAVKSSQMLEDGVDSKLPAEKRGVTDSRISMTNAFYLATAGGAEALHLNSGQIETGRIADLQIVKAHRSLMPMTPQDVFERLMYQSEPADIKAVYVAGKQRL